MVILHKAATIIMEVIRGLEISCQWFVLDGFVNLTRWIELGLPTLERFFVVLVGIWRDFFQQIILIYPLSENLLCCIRYAKWSGLQ